MSTPKDQTSDLVELTPSKRLSGLIHSTGSLASPTFEHCINYDITLPRLLAPFCSSFPPPSPLPDQSQPPRTDGDFRKQQNYHLCHPMFCHKHIPCSKIPAMLQCLQSLVYLNYLDHQSWRKTCGHNAYLRDTPSHAPPK